MANLGFNIYAIVSLEQTISRNHLDDEERDWTFGQILAIFMLLGVANELLNLFLAGLDRKAEERKTMETRPVTTRDSSAGVE